MSASNIWECIHSKRAWGRYPNEELVRFIGGNFFSIPHQKRKKIKILEVGCGQGANLWFLAKENFDVYGIDFSPSAIKKAKKYLENEWGIRSVKLSIGDIRDLRFKGETFDVVIDCATIWCISYSEHKGVYENIFRILKPKGLFWSLHIAEGTWGTGSGNLIDFKTFDNLAEGPLSNEGVVCMPSAEDLNSLLEQCGFELISLEKLTKTYQNQTRKEIYWIIQATKP